LGDFHRIFRQRDRELSHAIRNFRTYLFGLKWFDEWTIVTEQFDANALFGRFVMREELSSRFVCRICGILHCTRCHHDEIISENIPYIEVRDFNRNISDELLGSTNSACPTCSFVSPTDVTIDCLGSHVLVIINRVHQNRTKLNQHYNFPLRFQDKDLAAIVEHMWGVILKMGIGYVTNWSGRSG